MYRYMLLVIIFCFLLVSFFTKLYASAIGFYIFVTIFSIFIALLISTVYEYSITIKNISKQYTPYVNRWIDKYGIYVLLGLFFLFINYLTFSKHANYASSGFDLGIFDQAVYKYSQFQFPVSSSIREIANIEADHFHPILFVYGLVYKLYASPLVLLFLQNFFFVLGGLGIYKIAKYKLDIPIVGLLVVVLYLIFRGNVNALMFDFHPLVLAVSLFPWLLYFSLKKEWLWYFLLLIPILLTKENLSIYIVFFGIYQFFVQKERSIGVISFLIGLSYFYLVMNHFLPMMGGGGKYWSYDAVGSGPKEFIINSIMNPLGVFAVLFSSGEKLITYLHHLGSGLYIAILSPVVLFLIPAYAQKFLSSREEFWTLQFHYSIDIYWCIAIGIIFTFAWCIKKYPQKSKQLLLFFCVFIFVNSFVVNMYQSPLLYSRFALQNKVQLDKILQELPKSATVSTQNEIVPHLAHREGIYLFPNLAGADYILLNTRIAGVWPVESPEVFHMYIQKLKSKEPLLGVQLPFIKNTRDFEEQYELTKEINGILLFEKIQ